ncbi:hydrogen gas-evolving membrane-bound hydrogenase subunit E [Sandaracinus amylolyticus]|uniref:hydrogen gas-evolving membrane-bound hydrogenase subunit E n=1 Tax=Sandaracinus amylolyticus TaxID=927083 RepID=UPI001F377B61|nr:hydrogen gas-evolving membrane-bound hydrogenase subunit E [Sandaracinus amylolyticus]
MSRARLARIPLVLVPAALAVALAVSAPSLVAGRAFERVLPWAPSAGLETALRLDALSGLFALIVCAIGALVAGYAGAYFDDDHALRRFDRLLALFTFAMLALVLADDVFFLYFAWELTSVASFFLIGFDHERAEARDAARHALLVTVAGGLALLAGLVMLSTAAGTTRISEIVARGDIVRAHELYRPAFFTIAVAAFTKSAQVPFHSWLPRAMEAPTPASAYLHAATMVKAGVFLLARFAPALAGTPEWTALVAPIGGITAVVGAARAIGETRFKPALAYSTVAALGLVTLLLGIGTTYAIAAAMLYVVAHALYKGALFLHAGVVQHQAHAKDAETVGGMARALPHSAVAALLAGASMAGVPATLGFLAKDLAYAALLPDAAYAPLASAFVASALFVAVAMAVAARPLLGPRRGIPDDVGRPPAWLWGPPLLLAALGVVAGVAPALVTPLVAAAASLVAARAVPASALVFHGVGVELALSVVTLVVGVAVFAARAHLRRAGAALSRALHLGPASGYEATMGALARVAKVQTRVLQNGILRVYTLVTLVVIAVVVAIAIAHAPPPDLTGALDDLQPRQVGLGAFIIAAALFAVIAAERFAAVAALGAVGFGVGALFLDLGAPDLAMTQFVVEALSVVVFVLAFRRLPRLPLLSSSATRSRDALVALGFGALVSALALAAARTNPDPSVSAWFLEQSLPAAHGHNVVNVILTDFRSVDTLGETIVVATAGFGVFALLRLRARSGEAR